MSTEIDKTLILNKIKDTYGYVKDRDFANFLGISPQTLSSWLRRGSFDIALLYAKCVDISPEFLITGAGSVKNNQTIDKKNPDEDSEKNKVYQLKSDHLIDSQAVPLYNIEASAGVVALFNSHNNQTNPIDYIKIPNLPKCDGAIYVTGDSMYPLLKSGDIVMYKEVSDISTDIYWGEMYIIGIVDNSGDELVMVKYIQKSDLEGYVKLVSQNRHHQDKDVQMKKIKALALVKASIRMNSM